MIRDKSTVFFTFTRDTFIVDTYRLPPRLHRRVCDYSVIVVPQIMSEAVEGRVGEGGGVGGGPDQGAEATQVEAGGGEEETE